jgi:Protein of unknown function (DUF3014)
MEPWSARDDRPNIRPPEKSRTWWIAVPAIAVIVAGAGYYYYTHMAPEPAPAAPRAEAPVAPPAPAAAPEPAVRHPLETAQAEAEGLPSLDNSDSAMREALARLLGKKWFTDFVRPDQIVRRIVVTVDNLPREAVPQRMMPVERAPGRFAAGGSGEELTLDPKNAARYTPYVRVVESLDAHALAGIYTKFYPLFQRAYEEIGYPNRYFNDRVVEAIDDLLDAPEPKGPVKLVQPKVFYHFADPALEERSAGQKLMIRIGTENEAKVKAKLRELRKEVAK